LAVADLGCGGIGGFIGILANCAGYFYMGKVMCNVEGYVLSLLGKLLHICMYVVK